MSQPWSTDQVRFIDKTTDNVVDLVDISPLVLSEVLRDVDLFVGVASVGNDPTWQDSGACRHTETIGPLTHLGNYQK